MAITKPRNRVVLFRLTQEEYDRLQDACSTGGARSVSDYARARILGISEGAPSMAQVESRLDELTRAVDRLSHAVGRAVERNDEPAPRRAEAASGGYSSTPFLANSGD
ncbi:MAG: hypothetical protein ABI811_12480 [Acidobacteriota bacterium]